MTVEDAGARPLAGRLSVGPEPGRGRALALRILGRVARAVITLVGVAVVVFIVLRLLPGNQITSSLGVNAGLLTKAQYADLEHYYGIGKPLPEQFGQWAGDLLHGNLGVSEQSGRSVTSLIGAALPVTLELAIAAMLIALAGLGVPSFVIGSGLVALLASVFHYFPSSEGFASLGSDPWLNIQQIFWPALTLGLGIGAAILRTTRGAMLDVARRDYVRAARGRGLAPRLVIIKHVLRNALIPILTMSGIQFGYLLGGTVVVEQIFVLPGLGRLLLMSVTESDYAVAEGVTLVFALGFIVVNLLTDLLYAIVDPRLRS